MARSRCGATTRNGEPCQSAPLFGKKRCRMHGGAPGSGAPGGNRNALKTGLHTRGTKADRRALNRLMAQSERLLDRMG